jgi:hypothetical protein
MASISVRVLSILPELGRDRLSGMSARARERGEIVAEPGRLGANFAYAAIVGCLACGRASGQVPVWSAHRPW